MKLSPGLNGPPEPAADMIELVWDNELEMIAQRWANQCIIDNDDMRDVDLEAVGQNINSVWIPIGPLPTAVPDSGKGKIIAGVSSQYYHRGFIIAILSSQQPSLSNNY